MHSPDYPMDYGPNQECKFLAADPGSLNVVFFSTEPLQDTLTIHGVEYSGSQPWAPQGVEVFMGDWLVFQSNPSLG